MSEFDVILRIVVALLLGGLIGLEREIKEQAAGLRTHMLVSLGSALFIIAAELLTASYLPILGQSLDPSRVASTIVTGIGFLGAGVIFQGRAGVYNLTTAAGIWVAAAVGLLAGGGYFLSAISGAVITLVVLTLLVPVENWLHRLAGPRPTDEPADNPPDEGGEAGRSPQDRGSSSPPSGPT